MVYFYTCIVAPILANLGSLTPLLNIYLIHGGYRKTVCSNGVSSTRGKVSKEVRGSLALVVQVCVARETW